MLASVISSSRSTRCSSRRCYARRCWSATLAQPHRQVPGLRHARHRDGDILGLCRNPQFGSGPVLRLGAYMLAMSLKLASTTSLQQGSDKPVPDFIAVECGAGAPTQLCCITKASFSGCRSRASVRPRHGDRVADAGRARARLIIFRKRIAGVFVSIITLAFVLLVRLVMIDAQP